jgi:hypothetical protein
MDAFVSRKRRRVEPCTGSAPDAANDEPTDFKLAVLASLHPAVDASTLLEALLAAEGVVEHASAALAPGNPSPRKRSAGIGYQSSLSVYRLASSSQPGPAKKALVQKGRTLKLYSPADIESHTPCSIVHNFLPSDQADALLLELLQESPTYANLEFKLFDRVVQSPHTFCFW